MKKCKFCPKICKARELKKRTVKLPTGLEITSLDKMCDNCYNILQQQYEQSNNTSRDINFEQVEGVSAATPDSQGQ